MRTTINIDENLIRECRELTQLKTNKEIVESALQEFIKLCKRKKILELEGKIDWEGNLDEMRAI